MTDQEEQGDLAKYLETKIRKIVEDFLENEYEGNSCPFLLVEIDLCHLQGHNVAWFNRVMYNPHGTMSSIIKITEMILKEAWKVRSSPIHVKVVAVLSASLALTENAHSPNGKSGSFVKFESHVLTCVSSHKTAQRYKFWQCEDVTCYGHQGFFSSVKGTPSCPFCELTMKSTSSSKKKSGQINMIDAKFMPVDSLRNIEGVFSGFSCTIREPFTDILRLGSEYNVYGFFLKNDFVVLNITPNNGYSLASLVISNDNRMDLDLPKGIMDIRDLVSEQCPDDPWAFTMLLASKFDKYNALGDCKMSLKMGLLLSLATLNTEAPVPIFSLSLCLLKEADELMMYASRMSRRCIRSINGKISDSTRVSSSKTWFVSGDLRLATQGVCIFSDWDSLTKNQQNEITKVMQNSMDELEVPVNSPFDERDLRAAVWTNVSVPEKMTGNDRKLEQLIALAGTFGIPFMASYQTDVEYMLQVELNLGEGDNPMISEQDFIEFIRIANSVDVTIEDSTLEFIRSYCLAFRRIYAESLPACTTKRLIQLTKAHARLSLKRVATNEDALIVMYFYQKSLNFMFKDVLKTAPFFDNCSLPELKQNLDLFFDWIKNVIANS